MSHSSGSVHRALVTSSLCASARIILLFVYHLHAARTRLYPESTQNTKHSQTNVEFMSIELHHSSRHKRSRPIPGFSPTHKSTRSLTLRNIPRQVPQNSFNILTILPPTPSLFNRSVKTTHDWIPPSRDTILHSTLDIPMHSPVPVSFPAVISRPVVVPSVIPVRTFPSIPTNISIVPIILYAIVTPCSSCIAFPFSWICCVFGRSTAVPGAMAATSPHVVRYRLPFAVSISFAIAVTVMIARIWRVHFSWRTGRTRSSCPSHVLRNRSVACPWRHCWPSIVVIPRLHLRHLSRK
jgi:hypothetical protein